MLVEPAGPLNVGSVARLAANFGLQHLRLVAPRCDHLGEEARRMAVHAQPLLEQAQLFDDLAAALTDCRRVVACSGRVDSAAVPVEAPVDALAWLRATEQNAPTALVFGREDRGLSTDELLLAGRVLRIATDDGYPSLNLSHAVAIALHELRRLAEFPPAAPGPAALSAPGSIDDPALRGDLEATLSDAENLLLEVGFLLPHTRHARMAKVRTLLQRAQISSEEVALVRGMVRQLRWASRRPTP
ncbi:RNA methyltransferase [Cyanobium sp. Morenito 9A2]|nr:RNA methyltransferase [Cyanobium sp. Morenito 9A2]